MIQVLGEGIEDTPFTEALKECARGGFASSTTKFTEDFSVGRADDGRNHYRIMLSESSGDKVTKIIDTKWWHVTFRSQMI